MKILVIGYGSIGKRHAANVKSLGHDAILLRHSNINPNTDGFKEYYSFEEAIIQEDIKGAIICSPTSNHIDDVKKLVEHDIPFLLEKPPSSDLDSTLNIGKYLYDYNFNKYDIGLNLRYYPSLQFIKKYLPNLGQIYSSQIYVGYYLPYWRKNVDYRKTSSALKGLGGGVHIELVHEIDYALWFFGYPKKIFGYVNRISNLEISTEDICSALLQYKDGSIIELHLDYLSHKYLRGCRIIAEKGTLEWNMDNGNVYYFQRESKNTKQIFSINSNYNFNETYLHELRNFIGIINGENKKKISIDHAIEVMKVVEAIKISSDEEKSIYLKDIIQYVEA